MDNVTSTPLPIAYSILLDWLDKFKDQNEFCYVKKDSPDSCDTRNDENWWLKFHLMVSPRFQEGFYRAKRNVLVNQVIKAAMAINAQVLSEMEIPDESYLSLLKVIYST
ncbi:hypothetical protein Bca4012_064661 [Brassica carinata]